MLLFYRVSWLAVGVVLGFYFTPSSSPLATALPMPAPYPAGGVGPSYAQAQGTGECSEVAAVECTVRQTKCLPVSTLMQGAGGPVGDIFTCATQLAIPKTQIIPAIGPAFSSGHPESIIDHISNDSQVVMGMRRCLLLNAGLLGTNDTINREALAGKAQAKLSWNPPLAAIIAQGIRSCPEPPGLQYTDLLSCVRQRCINAVPVAAFAFTSPADKKKGKCSGKKKKGCKKH